uniref:Uncharacterized protein n=1 Tax=Aegilops tauschii TaxID=37682 RepID=M8CCE7_AEGTA
MSAAARRKAGLPAEFDAEVYGIMDALIRVDEALLGGAVGGEGDEGLVSANGGGGGGDPAGVGEGEGGDAGVEEEEEDSAAEEADGDGSEEEMQVDDGNAANASDDLGTILFSFSFTCSRTSPDSHVGMIWPVEHFACVHGSILQIICQDRVGVAPIEEKLVQHRLRWLGHIQRRPPEAPVHNGRLKRADNVKRGRGRPNLTWEESVKRDLKDWSITRELAMDRGCEMETHNEPKKSQADAWELANKLNENAQHIHMILSGEADEDGGHHNAPAYAISPDAMETTRQKADELIKSLGGLVSYLNQFTDLIKENGIEDVVGVN